MRNRWFRMLILPVIALTALVGCKSGTGAGELMLQEEKQEKTVLTMFMKIEAGQYNSASVYRNIISDFNEQSDTIEIRVDGLSTGDGYNEALERRLEAGKDVDLFIVNADSVKQLNDKGYFYDLSEQPVFKQLNDAARQQAVVDGTAYCVPTQMAAYGLYVNMGLLRQYGLTPPGNAGEFLNCCQILKDNGVTPLSLNRWYAMTAFAMSRGLYPLYQADNAAELIDGLNDGSIRISEYMLEGFRFFGELVDHGYYGDGLTVEQVDGIKANTSDWDDFIAEKTAFAVFPSGKEEDIKRVAPELEYIQQGFPVLPDGTVSMPSIASRLCVNGKGEHVEEALEALEYLTVSRVKALSEEGEGGLSVFEQGNASVAPEVRPLYEDAVSPGQIPIEDMSLCFDYWGTIRELCLDMIGGAAPEEAAAEYDRIQAEKVSANVP